MSTTPNALALIHLENLSKVFYTDEVETHALAGIHLEIQKGDYVAIAAPHTPATARMFGQEQLRLMKPSAYLINVGRGAIVELSALVDALRAGEIAGAFAVESTGARASATDAAQAATKAPPSAIADTE